MTIRPMRMEDYGGVVEVWRSAGLDYKPAGRESRAAIERQLEHYSGSMLVAEEEGRIVGVALGTHDYRKGWINRLAVAPDMQGCGIAKTLIAAVEGELERLGVLIFSGCIISDNEASRRLAGKAGYEWHEDVEYFSKKLKPEW